MLVETANISSQSEESAKMFDYYKPKRRLRRLLTRRWVLIGVIFTVCLVFLSFASLVPKLDIRPMNLIYSDYHMEFETAPQEEIIGNKVKDKPLIKPVKADSPHFIYNHGLQDAAGKQQMDNDKPVEDQKENVQMDKPIDKKQKETEDVDEKPLEDEHKDPSQAHCKPKTHLVYIKTFKCASATLTNIFRRFGYARNLSFVLPPDERMYLGWPYQMEPMFYRPTKTGRYDILCEHAVFNHTFLKRLMPQDTVYITSIREPFAQFKSMFNYYKLAELIPIKGPNPVSTYLSKIQYYDGLYKSHGASQHRYCVPDNFSMSYNLMSHTLGFPTGALGLTQDETQDESAVNQWLNTLDATFKNVLIVESFDESLVLMRRQLCWSWRDIIYVQGTNALSYNYADNAEDVKRYKAWSAVDYQLYKTFKNELKWRQQQAGEDYQEEVELFKTIIIEMTRFCKSTEEHMIVPANKWSRQLKVDREDCKMLSDSTYSLKKIKQQYNERKAEVPVKQHPKPTKNIC